MKLDHEAHLFRSFDGFSLYNCQCAFSALFSGIPSPLHTLPCQPHCLLNSTTPAAWIHIMVSRFWSFVQALPSFLNVLETFFSPSSSFKAQPPRSARLCASVIKYQCQTALNQICSCFSHPCPKDSGCVLAISVTHTALGSVLCLELYTHPCALALPSSPQQTEQRSPTGSNEARCLVPVPSSPRPSLGLVCVCDRGKWS